MKKIMTFTLLMISLSSFAHVDSVSEVVSKQPSTAEIESNRSCFKDLESMGCGDPGEDIQHFRSCMNNVYDSLSSGCKTLMNDLYKKR